MRPVAGVKLSDNLSRSGLVVWGIIRKLAAPNKSISPNNSIIMEKKQFYTAPAVRELNVFFDASFLQSTTGPIQDWGEDDDPINF